MSERTSSSTTTSSSSTTPSSSSSTTTTHSSKRPRWFLPALIFVIFIAALTSVSKGKLSKLKTMLGVSGGKSKKSFLAGVLHYQTTTTSATTTTTSLVRGMSSSSSSTQDKTQKKTKKTKKGGQHDLQQVHAASTSQLTGEGGGGGEKQGGGYNTLKYPLPVPNIAHFIFGLEENFGHIKFGLIHYLAVLGAFIHIQPEMIQFHYLYEPQGDWWECAKKHVTLVKEADVTEVWGRPMKMRVAHKADIIRMRILREEGGIYLDSDVIPLRSFEELRRYNLSMGLEGEEGLCNAVLVGAPNTTFINRWWQEYKTFDAEKQWAYHSVLVPRSLQRSHPSEVTVLSDRAFFTPMWTQLRAMYDKDDGYDYHANFAVHLWTSADERQRNRLGKLSPRDIFTGEGSFHRRMRGFLADALERGALCEFAANQTRALIERVGKESGNYSLPLQLKDGELDALQPSMISKKQGEETVAAAGVPSK